MGGEPAPRELVQKKIPPQACELPGAMPEIGLEIRRPRRVSSPAPLRESDPFGICACRGERSHEIDTSGRTQQLTSVENIWICL